MQLTWINQGGFIIQSGQTRLVIDPYFSGCLRNHQHLADPPFTAEGLDPSTVFITHDHPDHLDPSGIPELARRFPLCNFIGPRAVIEHLLKVDIAPGRLKEVEEASFVDIDGMQINVTRALHTTPAVGLVVHGEGLRLYVSGDTEYADDLADTVAQQAGGAIDIAAVCINGRLGNMNTAQAVKFMTQLGPRLAVPMHYGLFAENTADPAPFVAGCQKAGVSAVTLAPGHAYDMSELIAQHG
jgi:L-ascorbate metabolism protein UlaG (beta-lactamase superfamily)